MTHLDICNTIYGKKKGQESHWQFYSRPRKVGNQPHPVRAGGMQHTIEKNLNAGYNFALDLIPIVGLSKEL
jgi:hypothetical protein